MLPRIFVAAAWPYANGYLHLGHVAGLIGSDITARFFRLNGQEVLFVSGSDCHGTPITIEAEKQGISPIEIANKYHIEFKKTLIDRLYFSYDIYTTTTTDNHSRVVSDIFLELYKKDLIYIKSEESAYCTSCKRFLPDRYVEGECPLCHFAKARGDQCDECGHILDAKQLINPSCKICSHQSNWRLSKHFYLRLSSFQDQLKDLVKNKSKDWRINAKNFTIGLLENGLCDRAITRDTEFGVPIPLPGYENKRIYVWFEAVCGYLSASKEWSLNQGQPDLWQKFWVADESVQHYYVHAKDNILFHTIIWPAMLLGVEKMHLPDHIISSEFLTINSLKFSKSRNTMILVNDFLKDYEAETLRYYLVINGPETSDADFSWDNYYDKTNTELIGIFGNYVNRVLALVKNNFVNGVEISQSLSFSQLEFLKLAEASFIKIGEAIKSSHYRDGLRLILDLAAAGNRYIDKAAPWFTVKTDPSQASADLSVASHVIICLAILVRPFLPVTSDRILGFLNIDSSQLKWEYPKFQTMKVGDLHPLYKKLENAEQT